MSENMTQTWYVEFVDNLELGPLFDLILGANYMSIKPLLELCNAKVASMIKGKTPEQLRDTFQITTPYTPPDANAVREANPWAQYADCKVPAEEEASASSSSSSAK